MKKERITMAKATKLKSGNWNVQVFVGLDENGKKLLLELLILAPNDYWLNFIKNKNNE